MDNRRQVKHDRPSELKGKTVKIKKEVFEPNTDFFISENFVVEDWYDRVRKKDWKREAKFSTDCECLLYASRAESTNLPDDEQILYGKVGEWKHMMHISEIEV